MKRFYLTSLILLMSACSDTSEETDNGSSTDTTSMTSDSTGTDTGGMVCSGDPVSVSFQFSGAPEVTTSTDVFLTCDVASQSFDDQKKYVLSLMCSDGNETTGESFTITASPGLPEVEFPPQVNLRFVQVGGFGADQWARIETTDGELLFASGFGGSLAPKGTPFFEIYSPFGGATSTSDCALFDGTCGTSELYTVTLNDQEESWQWTAPATDTIIGYKIFLAQAEAVVDPSTGDCSDIRSPIYRLGIIRSP